MAKGERCRNEENSPDLDQITKDALDELFSKEQQTYEEFLQGFLFLKKDDVVGFKADSSHSDSQNGATCQEKKTDDFSTVVKSHLSPESCLTENDSIPEEVLEPGSTTASILMRTAEPPGRSFVQVDNFVDCEDDASDDDEEETQTVDPFLEDNFLSSNYYPSVPLCPSTSNSKVTEDNRTKGQNLNADLDDKCLESKEICYLSEGVSNLPGEVEEQETAEEGKECDIKNSDSRSTVVIKPNLRQLEISTRVNKGNGTSENNLNVEGEGTDEVQPFTLDTEFDYDNVALTPKFSVIPGKHMF